MRKLSRLLLACLVAACVNRDIVRPAETRRLAFEEIAARLASGNFREVLGARAQLSLLPDDAWLAALAPLAYDDSAQHRLVAAVELSRRPYGAARALLASLALDPDETVRTEASQFLSAAARNGGTP